MNMNIAKRVTSLGMLFMLCLTMNAQIVSENFSHNNMGWTQREKGNEAIIKRGKLHLESKGKAAISTCYTPIDVNKPFTISVEVEAKKLSTTHTVGMMVDVEDEFNFILFQFEGDHVSFCRIVNEKLQGFRESSIHVKTGRKITMALKSESNKLSFFVNGKKVIEYQKHLNTGETMIGTTGVGLYARGVTAEFDNFEINQ
jgi:hypothetical protein